MRKTSSEVIEAVAKRRGVSVADLKYGDRKKPLVQYRQEAMWHVYVECPHMSYPAIGRAFGGFDHTTCMHAVRQHSKRVGAQYERLRRSGPRIPGRVWKNRNLQTPATVDQYRQIINLRLEA